MYASDSFCISFGCGEDNEETLEFFRKATEISFYKNGLNDNEIRADGFSLGTGASWSEIAVYIFAGSIAGSAAIKTLDDAYEVIKKRGKGFIDFLKSLKGIKSEQEALLLEDKSGNIQAGAEDGTYSLGILKLLCLADLSGRYGEEAKASTKYIRSNVVYSQDLDLSYAVVNPIYIMIPDDKMNTIHFYSAKTNGNVEYLFKKYIEHELAESDYTVEDYEDNGVEPGYLNSVPTYYGADFKSFNVDDRVSLRNEGIVIFGKIEFSDEDKKHCLILWDNGKRSIEVFDDVDLVRD
jgi:hypothetical protein